MSTEEFDLHDPVDVAKLVFSAEDGVIQDNLTWQSWVVTTDTGEVFVDVYPDYNPMGEHDLPAYRYRVEHVGEPPEHPRP
ncbi:hypothetical protein L3Q67_26225 [Saccharothrix sp. AJ9571]|nr:hypothetical protein L3Q67_26225 [Saccharothrix sp. AJ9571]